MPPKRQPCRRCRNRIDADHRSCPYCGVDDPLRHLRVRRNVALVGTFATALALSAWLVLH